MLESMPSLRVDLTVDEALQQSVGELGRGQRWRFCLASLGLVPAAMQTYMMYFVGLEPLRQGFWQCIEPADSSCLSARKSKGHSACYLPPDVWDWTDRGRSIASEWDLVCGNAWKLHLVNAAFFAGCIVGVTIYAALSQHLGRKKVLGLSAILAGLLGLASAAAPAYWWYMGLRVCSGMAAASMTLAARALAIEPIGPTWRGMAGVASCFFIISGGLVTILIAFLAPSWRAVTFLAALPCIMYPALLPSIYESPSWLLSVGRKGEAIAGLAAIASANKTHLPDLPLGDTTAARAEQKGLLVMLHHARLRNRLLIMLAISACASQVYFGMSLSLQDMAGAVYVNQAVGFAIGEWWVRPPGASGGTACLLCGLTSGALQRVWALAGRFGAASAVGLAQLYLAELLSSDVQHAALAAAAQVSQVGAMAAPALMMLTQLPSAASVPFFVWGPTAIAAGLLLWLLPDTLGASIPASVQDLGGATSSARRLKIRWPRWPGVRQLFRNKNQSSQWTHLNDIDPDQE
ncbi:MAG: hypothetical protein FRX49_06694 [Trebouxia sp. A1-2]|nr:MAG: hypothetical protein FRX49_06694 [Trebouxia sp. A1-2]